MLSEIVDREFTPVPGYLNTATSGLPPRGAIAAMRRCIDDWENGTIDPYSFDGAVDRARAGYGALVGIDAASVGIVGQVSVASAMVAGSLEDGATVLCAEEDFTSVLYPFLVDDRLTVRVVPLDEIIDSIDADVDLVAVSAAQSSDGRVLNLDRFATAAAAHGTKTYLDVSQAAGWLPIGASRFDVTSCGAYKWLCSPRGTGFVSVRPEADWLIPRHAGWYSSGSPWETIYRPPLRLADDARRFNVSPAWFGFAAAAASVEVLAEIGVESIHAHSVGLANRFLAKMGLPVSNSAIVSVDSAHAAALADAGFRGAARAGRARLSFYVYNTEDEADAAASLLRHGTVT